MSDSPGLVDFAVGLVDFTLNLPKGQVKALGGIFFEEIRASWKIELLCTLSRFRANTLNRILTVLLARQVSTNAHE